MYAKPKYLAKLIRSSLVKNLIRTAYETGLVRIDRPLAAKSLTVLNYHRINDHTQPGFDSYRPNVSASPPMFASQMEYLSRWYNVVSLRDVSLWLDGLAELPPYPALITFDDGYLDNYLHAYPILRKHNFPAVIFLTTGHIETDAPFYWDLTAYAFFHTQQDSVQLPDGSKKSWHSQSQKQTICDTWIEQIKSLPDQKKWEMVHSLPARLHVSIPHGYFKNLMITWEQAREMSENGIEFGGHTVHHPILTRIPLEEARREICESKKEIEGHLGKKVRGFAYPNGMDKDLNDKVQASVSSCGYKAAFTLQKGPSPLTEVRNNPFAIRRIFVGHYHTDIAHFAFLLSHLNRYRG